MVRNGEGKLRFKGRYIAFRPRLYGSCLGYDGCHRAVHPCWRSAWQRLLLLTLISMNKYVIITHPCGWDFKEVYAL